MINNFILSIFSFLKNLVHFLKIVCVFIILLLILYWIQNLTNADWAWMNFIKPFFNALLNTANNIYSISFNFFGAVFELKYLSAIIILIILCLILNLAGFGINILEGTYKSARFVYKKTEETLLNKKLKLDITNEEKKIKEYTVVIHTKIKNKFAHIEQNIDIEKQNTLMNDFIMAKTSLKPVIYNGGFMYKFTDFEKIDNVLDIMFKLIHSEAPIEYSICIQINDNIKQLDKLIKLQNYGKITMAADTSYRYRYNETHRYQTSQLGIFQYENGTIELHEFKEIL